MKITVILSFILLGIFFLHPGCITATAQPTLHQQALEAPTHIEVRATTSDNQISQRLKGILQATDWFIAPEVNVENGVAFLYGQTTTSQLKDWAGNLAHHTQDVTAVVNKIEIIEPSWNIHLILQELTFQGSKLLHRIPALMFALIILAIAWMLASLVYKLILFFFRNKETSSLLHELIARVICFVILLFGIYFIFEMAELTTIAITVISGTGLLGIIIGIAFRDITENFLSSILLSMQQPFHKGDLIDIICPVTGYSAKGYVDRLTFRVTILMTEEGNHLQIANSTVYKSNIRNYTSNPHRRDDFIIALSSQASISEAQDAAIKVLNGHEAVLKTPESLVLVEDLSSAKFTLHIYYWIDSRKYSWLKVKSSLIRLIKKAFQAENIEPQFLEKESSRQSAQSESKLTSQAKEIKDLAAESAPPEKGGNLLGNDKQKKEGDKGKKDK